MKCSDVSNPIKSWPIYSEWIERITTEFLNQGDKEKELGLPVSPFCNRESFNTSLSQKSFINFIVSPLFDATSQYCPLKEVMDGLDRSKERFCKEDPRSSFGSAPSSASGGGGRDSAVDRVHTGRSSSRRESRSTTLQRNQTAGSHQDP